jgi:hypothetical protein
MANAMVKVKLVNPMAHVAKKARLPHLILPNKMSPCRNIRNKLNYPTLYQGRIHQRFGLFYALAV